MRTTRTGSGSATPSTLPSTPSLPRRTLPSTGIFLGSMSKVISRVPLPVPMGACYRAGWWSGDGGVCVYVQV